MGLTITLVSKGCCLESDLDAQGQSYQCFPEIASLVSDSQRLAASNTNYKTPSPNLKWHPSLPPKENSLPTLHALFLTAVVFKFPMIWQPNLRILMKKNKKHSVK